MEFGLVFVVCGLLLVWYVSFILLEVSGKPVLEFGICYLEFGLVFVVCGLLLVWDVSFILLEVSGKPALEFGICSLGFIICYLVFFIVVGVCFEIWNLFIGISIPLEFVHWDF